MSAEAFYNIKLGIDKNSVANIKTELQRIDDMTMAQFKAMRQSMGDNITDQNQAEYVKKLKEAQKASEQIRIALHEATNSKLGTVDVAKFYTHLKNSGVTLDSLNLKLKEAGAAGVNGFRKLTTELSKTNIALKESHRFLDSMTQSFTNTVKWGVSSAVFNGIVNSVSKAWNYTQKLDTSLNNIRIITGKSAKDMDDFAIKANKAAIALGKSTTEYTDASLIYYQQGYGDKEVEARTDVTLKAANVTGQSAQAVSEQLTAVWNGYKVTASEAEVYIDKLAAVAATTASDLEELSTGMSKVASAANLMGVDIDQLNAQLATIVSVTRQAPESVGTALKTIYARMGDIQAGLDEETTLGNYTKEMSKMGVNVLDAKGNLRDMGDVIEEIGNNWVNFSREQQIALSQTMAGTRQYNNLLSLFDNWDMYISAMETSKSAMGTLQAQQDIYMESTAAHLEQLSTKWESFYDTLTNSEAINGMIDTLGLLVSGLDNFVKGIGGAENLLGVLSATFLRAMGKDIAVGLTTFTTNLKKSRDAQEALNNEIAVLKDMNMYVSDPVAAMQIQIKESVRENFNSLSEEQILEANKLVEELGEIRANNNNSYITSVAQANKYLSGLMGEPQSASVDMLTKQGKRENPKANAALENQLKIATEESAAIAKASFDMLSTVKISNERSLDLIDDIMHDGVYKEYDGIIDDILDHGTQLGIPAGAIEAVNAQKEQFMANYAQMNKIKKDFEAQYKKDQKSRKKQDPNQITLFPEMSPEGYKQSEEYQKLNKENIKILESMGATTERLGIKSSETAKHMLGLTKMDNYSEVIEFYDEYGRKITMAKDKVQELVLKQQQLGKTESFINVIGAVGQMITALNMAKNLIETLASENVSAGEAIGQTITTLISIIMIGIFAWKGFAAGAAGAAKALFGVAAASWTAGKAMFAVGGVIAIVVAAVAILVGVIKSVNEKMEMTSKKAQRESQQLKKMTDAYNEARESVDALRESLEKYNETKTVLDEMIRGTEEWNDKLRESNEQVLDLIKKYPQLLSNSQYLQEQNGAYVLTEEGQDFILDEQKAKEEQAYRRMKESEIANIYAQNDKAVEDSARAKIDYDAKRTHDIASSATYGVAGGAAAGIASGLAIAGAANGWNPIGWGLLIAAAVAAGIGAISYAATSAETRWDEDAREAEINQIAAAYKKDSSIFDDKKTFELYLGKELTDKYYDDSTDQGKEMIASLHELCEQLKNNERIVQENSEMIANSVYKGSTNSLAYNQSEYQTELNQIGSRYINKEVTEDEIKNYKKDENYNETAAREKFMKEVLGYTDPTASHKGDKFFENKDDKEGVSYSEDEVVERLIKVSRRKDLEDKADQIISDFYAIERMLPAGAAKDAFMKILSQEGVTTDLSNLSDNERLILEDYLQRKGIHNRLGIFGTDKNELQTNYEESLKHTEASLTSQFEKGTTTSVKQGLNNQRLDYDDITGQEELAFYSNYQKAFENLSTQAITAISGILNDPNLSESAKESFIKIFGSINWKDSNAFEDFKKKMEEAGVQLSDWSFFERLATETQNNLDLDAIENIRENDVEITKLLKNLKNVGDVISAQDFEKFGEDAAEYFTLMSDGNYMLTKDAETFYEMIQGNRLKVAKENVKKILDEQEKFGSDGGERLSTTPVVMNTGEGKVQLIEELRILKTLAPENRTMSLDDINGYINNINNLTQDEYLKIQTEYDNSRKKVMEEGTKQLEKELAKGAEESNTLNDYEAWLRDIYKEDSKAIEEALEKNSPLVIAEQLNDLEIDESAFSDYIESLRSISSVSKMTTTDIQEMVLANIQLSQGLKELSKNWEDWDEILAETDENTFVHMSIISEMTSIVERMLSLPLNSLSPNFLKNEQNRKALKTFMEDATEENFYKFSNLLITDFIDTNVTDPKIAQSVQTQIQTLMASMPLTNIPIGTSVELDNFVSSMIEILEQANLTADQIETIFKNANIDVDISEAIPSGNSLIAATATVNKALADQFFGPDKPEYKKFYDYDKDLTPTKVAFHILRGEPLPYYDASKGTIEEFYPDNDDDDKGKKGKTLEDIEPLDEEIDRYHDINVILGQIEHELEMVEKAKEKAFGADLLKLYAKELNLLEDQTEATKKKIEIGEQWAHDLRYQPGGLADRGITFNEDGTVKNYEEFFTNKLAEYERMRVAYNANKTEAGKKALEDWEEDWKEFKEDFEKYEEIINEDIPGLKEELKDIWTDIIETQIASFNMEIEIHLELTEAERDWNKFRRKVIEGLKESDILGNVAANVEDFRTYYNSAELGAVQVAARHVQDLLAELKEMDATGYASGTYEEDRKQALEDLKTYAEELRKNMEAAYDLLLDTEKKYIDMLKEAEASFGKQIEVYKQVGDIITHNMKVIDLVYGEDSYSSKAGYYDRLVENDRKQIDFQRQEVAFWAAQMSKAQKDQNKEAYDEARKNWLSAVKEYNSSLEKSIENIRDKYINAINKIFQELNNKVTKGKGLEYIGEEWDLINKNADLYLDDINRAYGIRDLEKKYADALNGTDSLRVQEKIKKIMDEELKALREKDKLTEYDVERAERKYEILMKQIALEEAQQNKSQLRLRRDSQGNYTYQYTADEDAIAKAEADLEKAKNDLYNFDKAEYKDNLNQIYSIWSEFQEKMAEAAQINDPTKRKEREALLEKHYGNLINGLVAENATIRKNLQESAMEEVELMKDENLEDFMLEDIPYWTSGVQKMADVFAGEGGFGPTCKDAMDDLRDATEEYEEDLDDLEDVAEETFAAIKKGNDASITATENLIQSNGVLIQSYKDMLVVIQDAIDLLKEQIRLSAQAQQVALDAHKYLEDENITAATHAKWTKDLNMGTDYSLEMGKYAPGSEGYLKAVFLRDLKTQRDPTIDYGLATTERVDMFYRLGKNLAAMGKGTFLDITEAEWKAIEQEFKALGPNAYANDWNPETVWRSTQGSHTIQTKANNEMATSVNIMPQAAKILNESSDRLEKRLLDRLVDGVKAFGNTVSNIFNPKSSTTNQNVHIDASFPNVQSSNEILNALKNVVNVASQIANR